ncbi:MAG: CDP-diacylglycerol--glycerol-3-phosphate 3-phosphatidyltransferase [Eubacteriales bacterium]|nr:CDP-diacylglycerol--glycerol-3-phosphate 3-phosphatidyltransferase [Clostridiales bacterium]MDY5836163.1 CDP-diacylglycerol--glycerol-3-phosphate 3-phosphatidyltransferase [Eubacteriales bacterium]
MNLPNKLTIFRIILLVPLVFLLLPIGDGAWADFVTSPAARICALVTFILAALTDFLDGRIARKYNLITDFGKLMDSLADKLLVLGTFMVFIQLGRVHAFLVIIILARELLVTGIRQVGVSQGLVIPAGPFGKWKAACQMVTLVYLLAEPLLAGFLGGDLTTWQLWGNILLGLSLVLTVASGLDYFIKYRGLMKSA